MNPSPIRLGSRRAEQGSGSPITPAVLTELDAPATRSPHTAPVAEGPQALGQCELNGGTGAARRALSQQAAHTAQTLILSHSGAGAINSTLLHTSPRVSTWGFGRRARRLESRKAAPRPRPAATGTGLHTRPPARAASQASHPVRLPSPGEGARPAWSTARVVHRPRPGVHDAGPGARGPDSHTPAASPPRDHSSHCVAVTAALVSSLYQSC